MLSLPQPHEDLGHTADVGVRVRGGSAEEALARLCLALGAVLCGGAPVAIEVERRVAVAGGPDLAGSAVALLRELLYGFATAGELPAAVEVLRVDAAGAEARVGLGRYDPERHAEGEDVKAVTWHRARLSEAGPGRWIGEAAMPDIHWGYGFPIGGVAAVDPDEGAVSPGGVGYDINCGVRVVTTGLDAAEVRPRLHAVAAQLFQDVPAGVGASRAIPRLSDGELTRVLAEGAGWAVRRGFAAAGDDAARCEEGGCLAGADPEAVSARARERGADQLGTLGSGNHFLELDEVAEIYEPDAAEAFGLLPGRLAVQLHSGSRGLGYQVCDETLAALLPGLAARGPQYAALPDRQLACAPARSPEGRAYLGAMQAAANFAWANRQVMTGLAVRALRRSLGLSDRDLGARLLYDVCHNVAKVEEHEVDGVRRRVLVHRKGATRAFGPGDPRVPGPYRAVGQPVLVPGDMGRCSYVLAGTARAMVDTFGSSCHGAGRLLSRGEALRRARGRSIAGELAARGIEVLARAQRTLGEEMSDAYKDVAQVVAVMAGAGISRPVARLTPLAVIKG